MNRWGHKLLQLVLLGIFLLLIAVVLFVNWRCRRSWEACKQELEAKGERLDRAAFLPPDVPDEENFAATPVLAPLLAWRFDVTNRCIVYDDPEAAGETRQLFGWLKNVMEPKPRFQGAQFAHIGVREERFRRFPDAAPTEVRMMLDVSGTDAAARLLDVFKMHAEAMAELQEAARRPHLIMWHGRNPLRFPESPPVAAKAGDVGNAFRARALARMRTGDVSGALADVRTVLDISEKFRSEPSFWNGLRRSVSIRQALEPVWEGLARQQWQEDQLETIGSWLKEIDLISEGLRFVRAERADWIDLMEIVIQSPKDIFGVGPSGDRDSEPLGWIPDALCQHNQLVLARSYQEEIIPIFDTSHGAMDMMALNAWIAQQAGRGRSQPEPWLVFARMGEVSGRALLSFPETQAWVVMARLACALERHRLATGAHPEELAALVPQFINAIPPDPAGGGKLHYLRMERGRFRLYSVGPNGRDDGGNVVWAANGNVETRDPHCDWVWTYPREPSGRGRQPSGQ